MEYNYQYLLRLKASDIENPDGILRINWSKWHEDKASAVEFVQRERNGQRFASTETDLNLVREKIETVLLHNKIAINWKRFRVIRYQTDTKDSEFGQDEANMPFNYIEIDYYRSSV